MRAVVLVSAAWVGGCTCGDSAEPPEAAQRARALRPGRPDSKKALVGAALDAIRHNDPAAFTALIPSLNEMKRLCPGRFQGHSLDQIRKRRRETLRKVGLQLAACHKLLDWSRATRDATRGGAPKPPLSGCREEVRRLDDLRVRVQLDGTQVDVTLENPIVRAGPTYGLLEAPHCRRVK